MNSVSIAFAKLAGVLKSIRAHLKTRDVTVPVDIAHELFIGYEGAAAILRKELPNLFEDLPVRSYADPTLITYRFVLNVDKARLRELESTIEYIFEVRSHSELGTPATISTKPKRVFLTHGNVPDWREVQAHIEKDLKIETLELAQQPNRGRTVLQKLDEESKQCCYAVIVMTGDDRTEDGQLRARENVMHEIGFFQARFGLANVCLLHEEGVNIPSNISGVVYIPFPKDLISASFGALGRELRDKFKV